MNCIQAAYILLPGKHLGPSPGKHLPVFTHGITYCIADCGQAVLSLLS